MQAWEQRAALSLADRTAVHASSHGAHGSVHATSRRARQQQATGRRRHASSTRAACLDAHELLHQLQLLLRPAVRVRPGVAAEHEREPLLLAQAWGAGRVPAPRAGGAEDVQAAGALRREIVGAEVGGRWARRIEEGCWCTAERGGGRLVRRRDDACGRWGGGGELQSRAHTHAYVTD